jgi:DNA-binding transcriptional regulator YiaG
MLQPSNAVLSLVQRIEIKRLYHQEKVSIKKLMAIYQVSRPTIKKWVARESPYDLLPIRWLLYLPMSTGKQY